MLRDSIKRIEELVYGDQRGMQQDKRVVNYKDLRELLEDWRRLDDQARERYNKENGL